MKKLKRYVVKADDDVEILEQDMNEDNEEGEICYCGFCSKITDGTQYSYDENNNKIYFCDPLHHFRYFEESELRVNQEK